MRARNIKPGFFKNAELADAGLPVRLLFIGLWCMADREGRLKDKPRVIKAEIFPFDHDEEVQVTNSLSTLVGLGLIRRYVSQGIAVIEVVNFKSHQSPHHTEKASDLPAFVSSPLSNGGNPSDSLIPDSLIPDSSAPPASPACTPKKATYVASRNPESDRREEGKRMWPRVLAAIQFADLQKSFAQDGDVQRAVRQIGGWQRLGMKNRDLRGQTEQEFLNAFAALAAMPATAEASHG